MVFGFGGCCCFITVVSERNSGTAACLQKRTALLSLMSSTPTDRGQRNGPPAQRPACAFFPDRLKWQLSACFLSWLLFGWSTFPTRVINKCSSEVDNIILAVFEVNRHITLLTCCIKDLILSDHFVVSTIRISYVHLLSRKGDNILINKYDRRRRRRKRWLLPIVLSRK